MVRKKKSSSMVFKYISTTIKMLIILIIVFSFASIGIVSGSIVGFIKNTSLLTDNDLKLTNFTSIIYDNQNREMTKLDAPINREWIKLEDIQDELKYAFISIEDKRFYKHKGVDFEGFLRAVTKKIKNPHSNPEGASTITMQLVKNLTQEKDVSVQRKIKEQWRALQLEKKLSKNKILELYLNIIFLGNRSYGVKSAAMTYFNKDLSKTKLTLAEAACIAGITQKPTYYDPLRGESGKKNNLGKQKVILKYMLDAHYVSQAEYDQAINENVNFVQGNINKTGSTQSYFVDAVIDQVVADCKKLGMQEQLAKSAIYNNGWKIYTTMDSELQGAMDQVFQNPEYFPFLGRKNGDGLAYNPQAGMVLMDQHTGDVKALYGGYGVKSISNSYNHATAITRGPGSTFKPIGTYAPALQTGVISPCSVIDDLPIYLDSTKPGDKYPKNFGENYHGFTSLRTGISQSYNVVLANVWRKLDKDKAWEFLLKSGFKTKPIEYNYLATALGAYKTNPLQLAGAYTPLANYGLYIEPTLYTKVVKQDGTVLIDKKSGNYQQEKNVVYNEGVAYAITDLLNSVVESGTARGMSITNTNGQRITTSAKTGTNEKKDRWFVGYTPYYLGTVWYGDEDNKDMPYLNTNPAGTIWKAVMQAAHKNAEPKEYVRPDNIVYKSVCSLSGKTRNRYCSGGTFTDLYINGISPDDYCDVHTSSGIFREFLKAVLPKDRHYVIWPDGSTSGKKDDEEDTDESNDEDHNNRNNNNVIVTPQVTAPTNSVINNQTAAPTNKFPFSTNNPPVNNGNNNNGNNNNGNTNGNRRSYY